MSDLTRREFISKTLVGAGALGAALGCAKLPLKAPAPAGTAADRITLGKTGIVASRLAMGSGMSGSAQSHTSAQVRMGREKFIALIRRGLEHNLNFFDMADLYGSHTFFREALAGIPRADYVLLTKVWFRPADWNVPETPKGRIERFLKECGTDYLDVALIHCVTKKEWPEEHKRFRDDLSELKQQKKVRAVGVSCHSLDALKVAAVHPWVDLVFARINNVGGRKAKMDGTTEEVSEVLRLARKNGKAVLAMKVFGEGTLIEPEQKDASLKYILGNDLVDAMSIGMMTPDEVDDSVARIKKALQA